ncbi:acyl-CoA-binding protein [Terrabacter sp. NPDC080008]|uniref:acyl-CoA-binding protein n=1 Tax=Terrabacter sp. NPDC080008 TaxID=3155176 RepID=UPI00344E0AD9
MARAQFEQAAEAVKQLTTDPGNEAKLRLYGLYKQATEGDVSGSRPGFTNPVGRQKFDAWAAFKGTSSEAAQEQYVALVNDLTAR